MTRRRKRLRFRKPSRSTLVWIAVFAACAALHVWLHLKTTDLGYELAAIRQIQQRLSAEHGELEVELATLTSPRTLDRIARVRLGMRPPTSGQIVGLP